MPPVSVNPQADLAARPNAEEPTKDELLQLELFQQLVKKPDITKFPQSMVIRRIAKGEIICRQGEAGSSAYYVLTTEDVLRLKNHQLEQVRKTLAQFEGERPNAPEISQLRKLQEEYRTELSRFEQRRAQQSGQQPEQGDDHTRQNLATAYLLVDSPQRRTTAGVGLLGRVRRLFTGENGNASKKPDYISIDGPSDVDYEKRTAPMFEGDIFGEMSCLAFAPRSATVVAEDDCYLLEFLRSIFDQIQKDSSYKERTEEVYRKRVLATQFRRMEFFSDVDPESLDIVRQNAHLEIVEPGTVICDEGDPSDSVYLIRSGLVQIVKNANVSLTQEDILHWPKFCSVLLEGETTASEPSASKSDEKSAKAKAPVGKGGSSALDELKAKLAQMAKPKDEAPPALKKSAVEMLKERLAAQAKDMAAKKGAQGPVATEVAVGPKDAAPPKKSISKPDRPSAPASQQPKSDRLEKLMADIAAKSVAKKEEGAAAKLIEKSTTDTAKPTPVKAAKREKAKPGEADPGKTPAAKASPLDALKRKPEKPPMLPSQKVWQALSAEAQNAVRRLAKAELPDETGKLCVVDGLNRIIRDSAFVTSSDLKGLRDTHQTLAPVRAFGKAEKNWTGLDVRLAGRLLLEAIYPGCIRSRLQSGTTPRILAYLSRGDIFGEMGVVDDEQSTRTATVIAYDHPPDDSGRRPSRLEIVRVDKGVFRELLDRSPELRRRIEEQIQQRRQELREIETEPAWEADELIESSEFRDMGFAQGQRMLLIDLDRCTRCGDCVRACINTHADGHTRLFLDGPRFDRFLVPSACRSCRNPACMIGCPVSSIQRGDNGEILIRDWCIGCGICAKQCPYDSIQMHDNGLVAEHVIGWRYALAATVGNNSKWQQPGYRADGWHTTLSPIYCDFDFHLNLEQQKILERDGPHRVNFRYAFNIPNDLVGRDTPFRLEVESHGEKLDVWLNGQPIEMTEETKKDRRTGKYSSKSATLGLLLKKGENVIAAAVTLPATEGKAVLSLRLDRVPEIEHLPPGVTEAEAKLVTDKAVVCDLCSSLPSKDPACVAQCPHDAAFRIDALYQPKRLLARDG